MKRAHISTYIFWAVLLLPSLPMVSTFVADPSKAEGLLHPSGEFAARFMIIAMMISPLRLLFPKTRWLHWLMRQRRYLGFGHLDRMGGLCHIHSSRSHQQ